MTDPSTIYTLCMSKGEMLHITKQKLDAIAQANSSFFEVEDAYGNNVFLSKAHIVSATPDWAATRELRRELEHKRKLLESADQKEMTEDQRGFIRQKLAEVRSHMQAAGIIERL